MKSTNWCMGRFWILSSLFTLFYGPTCSQSTEETLSFADQLFSHKQYAQALAEYQRVWLFNTEDSLTSYLYNQIALVHIEQGNLAEALNYKELAYKSATYPNLKEQYFMEGIVLGLALGQYQQVIRKSLGIRFANNPEREKEKKLYLGIAYFGLGDFEEAERHFIPIASDTLAIAKLLHSKKLHRPNPKTAQVLSGILPGTGQFYAGDVKNGINSTVLLGAIAYLGYIVISRYGFINAVISVVPLYQRYYMGGMTNAKRASERKLIKNRNDILKSILNELKKSAQ